MIGVVVDSSVTVAVFEAAGEGVNALGVGEPFSPDPIGGGVGVDVDELLPDGVGVAPEANEQAMIVSEKTTSHPARILYRIGVPPATGDLQSWTPL